jgi:uncharacterized repeat protein (TIGR03803 family)
VKRLCPVVLLCVLQAYSAAQTYSALHNFSPFPSNDGTYPLGSLVRDGEGTLYRTTYSGGNSGVGTLYKLDSSGNETILYSFTGGTDLSGRKPDWSRTGHTTCTARPPQVGSLVAAFRDTVAAWCLS